MSQTVKIIDLPGQAIYDHHFNQSRAKLWIQNTYGNKEQMDVSIYFREFSCMPQLEKIALANCSGKVLDIGAGAGSHSLQLQQQNIEVTALEISAKAADVMRDRGIKIVEVADIYNYNNGKYHTLLLLMNGIGLCATIAGLKQFLQHAKSLLLPGGKLLFDSSDVAYVYDHDTADLPHYYGEIQYRYQYKNMLGPWFSWLYIDKHTLTEIAGPDFTINILFEDDADQYLVEMQPKQS